MPRYYTEYPTSTFLAKSDDEALEKSNAKVIYRESNTENGLPFVIIKEIKCIEVKSERLLYTK